MKNGHYLGLGIVLGVLALAILGRIPLTDNFAAGITGTVSKTP